MKKIGFIGLGIMGMPMSQNLLKDGYDVTVYNRSRAPIDALVSLGAKAATSPREVAERSDVVITMVTDTPDVERVMLGRDGVSEGARRGSIAVDMSTISPAATRKIADELSKKGVTMLDAPVSGGDKGAKDRTLTIMVGGPEDAYNECLPLFKAMGKRVERFGPSGAGQLAKLANQILVSCNLIGVCECLAYAKKAGLDRSKLIESLSAGAASSWSLANLGPKAVASDFAPGFKVKLLQKDLRLVLASADELKVALPGTSIVHQLFNAVEAAGMGEQGTQALITVVERLTEP